MSNSIQYLDLPGIFGAIQQIQGGQQKSRLLELQSQMEQQKYAAGQKQLASQQAYGASLPAAEQPLFAADPGGYIGSVFEQRKPQKPVAVTEGGALVDPLTNEVVYSRQKQSELSFEGGADAPPQAPGARLRSAAPPTAAPPANGPPTPISPNYAGNLKVGENNTNNPAATNPNSSATGDHQFIEETFLDQVFTHRPDLAQGKTREQILKLREDPAISADIANTYAADNTKVLTGAGFEATPTNLAIAHRFGPTGAVRILTAEKTDPNTPLASVLSPAALAANPHLRDVTIAQGRAQLDGHMNEAGQGGTGRSEGGQKSDTAADPPGVRRLLRKGAPDTAGADPGYQWAVDAQGNRLQVPIRGSRVAEDKRREAEAKQAELELRWQTEARQAEAARTKQTSDAEGTRFDQETKLRGEFQTRIKGFDVAQQNYAALPELAKDETGGSDIALINAFYKTFAPDSTVLEGEFAMAGKAAGLPDRIVAMFQKAESGQLLTPTQRSELVQAAGQFFKQRKRDVQAAVDQYEKLARDGYKLDPSRVVLNPIRPDEPPPTQPPATAPTTVQTTPQAAKPAPVTGRPGEGVTVPLAGAALPPADIPTFSSPTDPALAALPSGAQFRDPNGVLRRKP